MAKANQKTKKEELEKTIRDSFDDWKQLLNQIKETAEKGKMPLLAKSLELDLEILKVYERAFLQVAE